MQWPRLSYQVLLHNRLSGFCGDQMSQRVLEAYCQFYWSEINILLGGKVQRMSCRNGGSMSYWLWSNSTTPSSPHTNRSTSFAARTKSANSGCGAKGLDFSSGWNWTPMNQGWSFPSTISGSWPSGLMPEKIRPAGLQLVAVLDVDLVAVAVAFLDHGVAVDLGDLGAGLQVARYRRRDAWCRPWRRPLRRDGVVALHPFLQVIDDGGEALFAGLVVEFLGPGVGQAGEVAGGLDHRHLHAEADAEVGDLLFAGELGGLDLAFGAAFAKAAGDEDGVEALRARGRGLRARRSRRRSIRP